jgi:hypothetical protein
MSNAEIIFLSMFVSLIVFLVLREVICWYFKINHRLNVMVDIRSELIQANKWKMKDKKDV